MAGSTYGTSVVIAHPSLNAVPMEQMLALQFDHSLLDERL